MADVNTNVTGITITAPALAAITSMRDERDLQDHDLRIFIKGMSCSGYQYGMGFDNEPLEDDTVVEYEGVRLRIDPVSLSYMAGSTVDYVDGPSGAGFAIINPNEQASSCGSCGSGSCGSDSASDSAGGCGCGDGGCCG